jgi:hypothetical protein
MMKPLTIVAYLIAIALSLLVARPQQTARAEYSASHLMDDTVFDNVNTMTETQIQVFLASKGPCLSNYTDVNPAFNPSTGWSYTGSVSASHIIYFAAHIWGLNPEVILATLQKEASLVSGTACDTWRYNSAMGYACPDSGGCNPKYAGFTKQVIWGSWQLKFNKERAVGNTEWDGDGNITYIGFMTQGTYKRCSSCTPVYYSGYATIDGQQIFLGNGTTASLYTYTPHLGQSFPGIFEGWFGSVLVDQNPPRAVFRLWNPNNDNHLYTIGTTERNAAVRQGYRYEGVTFYEYGREGSNMALVYRMYSPLIAKHFYTSSSVERDYASQHLGYVLEGGAYWAYADMGPGLLPVYRLLDPRTGKHLWTISASERDALTSRAGWLNEGAVWYAAN